MTSKLDYNWHLCELMALRGMYSTTDLRPLLIERGVKLSASQVYRLVTEKPERLIMKTLMALIDILSCRMDELIEPMQAAAPVRRAVWRL
ncbi:helix-turn-helix domain-containing protein [Streptomyces aureocirculatus]|uniref:helix-turn-helix domain-containing protein n=1 Tax=Streptomyces aureocirculatus TaxID=67275 RepID=UPI00099E0590|nr:helix-turn-helix transcriptional regulator [Streptomyces aureocirculatus]